MHFLLMGSEPSAVGPGWDALRGSMSWVICIDRASIGSERDRINALVISASQAELSKLLAQQDDEWKKVFLPNNVSKDFTILSCFTG